MKEFVDYGELFLVGLIIVKDSFCGAVTSLQAWSITINTSIIILLLIFLLLLVLRAVVTTSSTTTSSSTISSRTSVVITTAATTSSTPIISSSTTAPISSATIRTAIFIEISCREIVAEVYSFII